jgi:Biotin protein ligase C terminal domain
MDSRRPSHDTIHSGSIRLLTFQILTRRNEKVEINDRGARKKVTIIGLDADGYLCAMGEEGCVMKLSPDGNSFDLLQGLISVKR